MEDSIFLTDRSQEEILHTWREIGFLAGIDNPDKEQQTANEFERAAKWCSTEISRSDVYDKFQTIIFPMVRRIVMDTDFNDQPLSFEELFEMWMNRERYQKEILKNIKNENDVEWEVEYVAFICKEYVRKHNK
jgi:hypothetical protein